jgi:diguanylate cyclase (GGDEF)-like protein
LNAEYVIFYTEASIICTVILLILLITDRRYGTLQEKQIYFRRAVMAFILYFLSDACWAAVLGGVITKNRINVVFFNLTNYIILSLMAYEWFMFMAASENMAFRNERIKRDISKIPMLLSIVVMVVAYVVNPYYWISADNELNSMYYVLMLAAPVYYLLIAFIHSVINIRKTQDTEKKTEYLHLAVFPLSVLVVGMIQLLGLNAPTFCFGCTIMWLWFYIQDMQMMISMDALTQLNNRGQINRYLERIHYREGTRVILFMIDIDGFKGINDTYGHAEGDRALVLVSDALKLAGRKLTVGKRNDASVFLGRFGGDEFTVILQDQDGVPAAQLESDVKTLSTGQDTTAELNQADYPEIVVDTIRTSLLDIQKDSATPYAIKVSIGYAELSGENDTLASCIVRADEMLYEEKRKKGAGR